MRTTKSTVSFSRPFTLNKSVGELPAGQYEIEVDEEVIGRSADRTAYRRVAIYFYVRAGASTRTIVLEPKEFDAALEADSRLS